MAATAAVLVLLLADNWTPGWNRPANARLAPANVEELSELASAAAEIGLPAAEVVLLASRAEFVPLSARETLQRAELALR